jgi:ribosomal peptide maturation radical SAM protein 1
MGTPDVTLIVMPWYPLALPSYQGGIAGAVLRRAGISTETHSLTLEFMDHCVSKTADRPVAERLTASDYTAVSEKQPGLGLRDWIFAVPPFRDSPHDDEAYLTYLREQKVDEAEILKASAMRAVVPAFLERSVETVLASEPGVVAFTVTPPFSETAPALVLSQMLKVRDASLPIVFFGGDCDGPMGAALHRGFPWVDVVVRGDAEPVLADLVKDLLVGGPIRPVPGLCYRDDGRSIAVPQSDAAASMDEIPTPDYDEYFERLEKTSFVDEVGPQVRLQQETSRGCWWGEKSPCTFCGLNGTSMAYRSKSPERVVEEMSALARRYQRLDFHCVDLILDPAYLREVLPRLRDAPHDFGLFYEVKSNLRREHVALFREAGTHFLQPGIESFSTPILRLMRKGVTGLQNVRLLKWCAEYGIHVFWNIVWGIPGEPPEEYARMANAIASLTHLSAPTLCRLVLHRFSPYYERPADFALEILGPLPWYRLVYPVGDDVLTDLAHDFAYRYVDRRDPESYAAPLLRAIEAWRAAPEGYRSLRYRRGPGFVVVEDRRPNLPTADYTFEDREARVFLACRDGATAAEAHAELQAVGIEDLDVDDVREFLDELLALRLAYEEGGRYLALPLPVNLKELP